MHVFHLIIIRLYGFRLHITNALIFRCLHECVHNLLCLSMLMTANWPWLIWTGLNLLTMDALYNHCLYGKFYVHDVYDLLDNYCNMHTPTDCDN